MNSEARNSEARNFEAMQSEPSSRKFVPDPEPFDKDSPQSGIPAPTQNRWALLVGINRYVDPAFAALNFCVNDVLALEKLLKQLGYVVVCLHDNLDRDDPRFPTRDNIEAELTKLCSSVGKNDLLLVHFACHGVLIDRQPYLITQETRHVNLAKRAFSLTDVESLMRSSPASRLILTLDACHTGAEIGRDVSNPEFIRNAYELAEGFVLFAASTAQQEAQEWKKVQHGVFTYYLLEGLSGKATQGDRPFVTVNDLQTYVLGNLRRWNVQHGGRIQEPTVRSEGLGDMILADYRSHPLARSNQEVRKEPTRFQLLQTRCKPRTVALTSVGIALALAGIRILGVMQFLELRIYDTLIRSRFEPNPDPRLMVIKVTREDLAAERSQYGSEVIGSFSSQTLTRLLEKLDAYKPKAIGFDFYREQEINPTKHKELVDRLKTQPNLFAICKGEADTVDVTGIAPPPNVPLERVGFSDFILDPDGILRRQFLTFEQTKTSPCQTENSFSLAIAAHYLKADHWTYSSSINPVGLCENFTFEQGDRKVRFRDVIPFMGGYQGLPDAQTLGCQILANYRSHQNVAKQFTLSEVLNDRVPVADYQDRIILIGVVHRDTNSDYWATPFGASDETQMPGVLIQANMVSSILDAVSGERPQIWVLPQWGEWLWLLLWCSIGGGLGWWFRSPKVLVLVIVGSTLGLYIVCFVVFQLGSGWLPYLPCILGVWIVGGIIWWLNLNSSLSPVSDSD